MGPIDFALSANFCIWLLHRCVEEPEFLTTGTCFKLTKLSYFGMIKNPHAEHDHGFQQRFDFNVWVGIMEGSLNGPYLLPLRLTGNTYVT